MGIENRDYVRDSDSRGGYGPSRSSWAIKYLIIANIVVFVLTAAKLPLDDWFSLRITYRTGAEGADFFIPDGSGGVTSIGVIPPETPVLTLGRHGTFYKVLFKGQVGLVEANSAKLDWLSIPQLTWRLVTYGFCHSQAMLMHIVVNMYVLWMFGQAIEPIYGSREFLGIFLAGVVVSGLCDLGVKFATASSIPTVGASGGVMAVVFLTAMHYPRQTVLLMFVVPIQLRWLAIGYAAFDVIGLMRHDGNVAHAAHLGGAAFGVAYKYYNWRITGFWKSLLNLFSRGRPRLLRGRPKVRLYEPSHSEKPERLDEQVDAILEKISEQGEASLSDYERNILKAASRRYKKP